MAKIKLSIKPLQEALKRTHPDSGAAFVIAPLSGERDRELTQECADLYGNVDSVLFARKVAAECMKGWTGVGDKEGEQPCNAENIDAFARNHAVTIMPWFIRQARSIEHYREQEIAEAKNV